MLLSNPRDQSPGPARDQSPAVHVPHISRGAFLDMFGQDYGPGQHFTFLGPTQRGKTTLCHQCLSQVISPAHKAVILAGKPPGRDHVMAKAAARLRMDIVKEWPPTAYERWHNRNRNGFVLRPAQSLKDLEGDERNLRHHFRAAMLHNYASPPDKPVITVVDEASHVQNDLKLKREYEAPLVRGAPVNAQWSLIQRGRYMSYHAYDAPEHIVIFQDPDVSNVRRYSEMIGGVNPREIADIVSNLKTYRVETGGTISEALYIRRAGPELYVVDVK